MVRILRFLFAVSGLVAMSAFGQSALQEQIGASAVQARPDLKNVRVDQHPGAQIPLNATFTDESGKLIAFGSLLHSRPLVLLPIFFRCKGVCEVELQGILNALIKDKNLTPGKDLDIAVLSIDPKEKSDLARGKKASSLEMYGRPETAAGWHFLTGDMANIRAVTDAMGFSFTYDADQDRVNHPSGIMVITPTGRVSTYMLGGNYQPSALTRDVLLASKAGIAPKSEEIFFGCVHVDPITGKRSLVIQSVLRLAGLLTVGGIVLMLVTLSVSRRTPTGGLKEPIAKGRNN